MTETGSRVRPARPEDRDAFLAMWEAFVATDPDEPGNPRMGAVNWGRVTDEACAMGCLIAEDAVGVAQGFLLHLSFPFTWSRGDICYLQDLFVRAEARGQGHARALIAALEQMGQAKGWYKIFWMTQAHNAAAQRLYDRVGIRRDYIRYDLITGDP